MITQLHSNSPAPAPHDPTLPHVLLVVDQFGKTLGGGERIVLKLAAQLPAWGYRVSILTFAVHPQSPLLQSPAPCPVYTLPLQRTYDLTALRGAFALRQFIRQHHIRIVQTFFESSDIWAGFVTKTMSRASLIWSRRDMGILRTSKHHAAYRLMARLPDKVFTVSELVRQYTIDTDHVAPEKVQTIYNGLNLADFAPSAQTCDQTHRPPTHWVIATVGNIRHIKGHDILLRAAALVIARYPNITFQITGEVLEPAYMESLDKLIRDLNLTGRVRFTGGSNNLPQLLAAADLFVLPSRSEGFSNAIIEAMAAGLPVVATNVGGNAEAVQHGTTGLIVPPQDPEAMAAAILALLDNPHQAQTMGTAGRQLVLDKFTTEAMMRQTTHVYATLLAQ